jgi:hypothetical protein
MPVAAIADIHGNVQALDAVLVDPRFTAAERIVVLGDVVAGTFPAETFDRLAMLGDRVRILRGNADRLVLEGDIEESRWVRDRLGQDRLASVATWPTSFAVDVEYLGAVRCCHAMKTTRRGCDNSVVLCGEGGSREVPVGSLTGRRAHCFGWALPWETARTRPRRRSYPRVRPVAPSRTS